MQKYLFSGILIASLLSVMNYNAPLPTRKNIAPKKTPSIGAQIQLTRINKGYSQKFLCRMTGLNVDILQGIEKGELEPTLETMFKIQDILGGAIVIDGDAFAKL